MTENEDLFAGMPEGEEPAGEQLPTEPTAEEKEKLRNLAKAEKAESDRLAAAQKKLDDARAARKKTEDALKKVEAGEEEPEAPAPVAPSVDVAAEVTKALNEQKRKDYLASVAEQIRGLAKNKKEAMEAYEEAIKLPPTGDAKMDAEFAFDRVQKLKSSKRGFTPPSVGGSFADLPSESGRPNNLGVTDWQADRLQNHYGLSKDEIAKYKDGVKVTRLFTK